MKGLNRDSYFSKKIVTMIFNYYKLLLAFPIVLFSNGLFSQSNYLSLGASYSWAVGDIEEDIHDGIGIIFQTENVKSDKFSMGMNFGCQLFKEKETSNTNRAEDSKTYYVLVPIQGFARYYLFAHREKVYVHLNAGVSLLAVNEGASFDFVFTPEIGYFFSYEVSVGVGYQTVFLPSEKARMLALSARYNFN